MEDDLGVATYATWDVYLQEDVQDIQEALPGSRTLVKVRHLAIAFIIHHVYLARKWCIQEGESIDIERIFREIQVHGYKTFDIYSGLMLYHAWVETKGNLSTSYFGFLYTYIYLSKWESETQEQDELNEVELRRSKRDHVEKQSFGVNFLTFMVDNEPQNYS